LPKNRAPKREIPAPPVADAKAESARLVGLGKQAFTSREYARAERRFQEAVSALPDGPLAHFLLAQARYALGKYQEAVVAIEAGLRLRPDWPTAPFRPRELCGMNEADYTDHLERLADALAKYPNDPFLLFLYAYQLWFDGRQWEARLLFQRARSLAPDTGPSDRFLHAMPSVPIMIW
jgi:tetratricopeptide (TPR) repeat protein